MERKFGEKKNEKWWDRECNEKRKKLMRMINMAKEGGVGRNQVA